MLAWYSCVATICVTLLKGMKHGPDLNRISNLVLAWKKGVVTFEEAKERLMWLMEPSHFMPEEEQVPEESTGDNASTLELLKRIEHKLNIFIRHESIPLPDELNPEILAEDVKKLANENRKIEAIQLHRKRTGGGLAEAKRVLDEYLSQNKK